LRKVVNVSNYAWEPFRRAKKEKKKKTCWLHVRIVVGFFISGYFHSHVILLFGSVSDVRWWQELVMLKVPKGFYSK